MKYSQQCEEEAILEALAGFGPGSFLDIGAADGRTFSNTLALAERGWSGVCVEPTPHYFPKLVAEHQRHPNVMCVQALVGASTRIVPFYLCPGLVSTTEPVMVEKWRGRTTFTKTYAVQLSLEDLLLHLADLERNHFDVVSIDTEGTSVDIFLRMPLRAYRVVVVEYDDRKGEVVAYAESKGMRVVYENGTNVVVAR